MNKRFTLYLPALPFFSPLFWIGSSLAAERKFLKILLLIFFILQVGSVAYTQNWNQIIKATAGDRENKTSAARSASDNYGYSVAVSGNYAIVGAYAEDEDSAGNNNLSAAGAAFILFNNAGTWLQIKKITASTRAISDNFGISVAISGDYAIVGAYNEDEDAAETNNLSASGSAYIFKKDQGGVNNWGQIKKITASTRAISDNFGNSVAISGDYAIVGAYQEDEDAAEANTLSASGSAYIFKKDQGGVDNWGQIKKITAATRAASDNFGSVAIAGDYAIVGAYNEDEDAAEVNNLAASGSAYIFKKDQGGVDNWGQIKKITASIRAANDWFGYPVAISGDYVIVGANKEDEDAAEANSLAEAGSAYIFKKDQGGVDNWGQIKKITASTRAATDWFGYSVAISGDYAIVGAHFEDEDAAEANTLTYAGSAYIFKKDQGGVDNWGQIKKITASIRAASDYFGFSVAIAGDTAIVGAYQEGEDAAEANTLLYSGSAYFFQKDQGGADNWGQTQKTVMQDRTPSDNYGYSVAISGNYAIVGAQNEDEDATGGNTLSDAGAAYILFNNAGNWIQVKKITASARAVSDLFGNSVAIAGDYAIVGAYQEDEDASEANTLTSSGSAFIFKKDQGGVNNWGQIKKITASSRAASDFFGISIAISGDYAIVGAYFEDEDAAEANNLTNAGSAYIFKKDEGGVDNWGQLKKITASTRAASDFFGKSVTIAGDYAIVGAYGEDEDATEANNLSGSGSAYIFKKDQGGVDNWGQVKKITASTRMTSDNFGYSVSIAGEYSIVGANLEDEDATEANSLPASGSAYIFKKDQGGVDNWGQIKKITASTRAASDNFGYSVAIAGDFAIVGAYLEDEDSSETNNMAASGSAYIFKKNQGSVDNWGQIKKITASTRGVNDNFGNSVSIAGDYAIVGANLEDEDAAEANNLADVGSAYIFLNDCPTSPVAATVNNPTSPASICTGTSINLNATSAGNTINWYNASSGGTLIGNSASGANFSATPSSTISYYAEAVTGVGCPSETRSATALITVNPLPQGSLTGNEICSGGTGQLMWTKTTGTGPFSVSYNGGSAETQNGATSGLAFNSIPNPGTTTVYNLTSVTDANGCVRNSGFTGGSATITVNTVAPSAAPVASAGSGATTSTFNANWSASTGATGYYLDVSTDNGFTALVSGYTNLDVGNVLTKNVSGLTQGTTYYYRLRAYNSCGTNVTNSGTISTATSPATVNAYCFNSGSTTYSAISGGTLLGSGSSIDDNVYSYQAIGFSFNYIGTMGGSTFTTVSVSSNGFITFIAAPEITDYTPISTNSVTLSVISAFGRDLVGTASGTLRMQTSGSAPNRKCVIQWGAWARFISSAQADNLNFQIILYETSNKIDIVYGSCTATGTAGTVQVGLRGTSISDFNNRKTTPWSSTVSGTVNTDNLNTLSGTLPSNGLFFSYSPLVSSSGPVAGTATVNPGQSGVAYSVGDIANATSYNWVLPTGATITSGSGTNALTVNYSCTALSGNLTVNGVNICGSGASASFAVTLNPELTTSPSKTDVSCNGGSNGTATANAGGGTPGYNYNWSGGGTTSIKTGLVAGTHYITVTDGNGCTAFGNVTIAQPTALSSTANSINATCNGLCNGTLSASASGGTTGYSFSWSGGLGAGATKSGVCPGTYTVTVTDANSCIATKSATVNQPAALTGTATPTAATCNGVCNGALLASGSGGTSGYTYQWSGGLGPGATKSGVCAGTYTVTVIDAMGCTATKSTTITQPTILIANAGIDVSICTGGSQTIGGVASGGTVSYTYLWAPSSGLSSSSIASPLATPSFTTTYTVTVTDANGCTATDVVIVTVNPNPDATISTAGLFCTSDPATNLSAATSGGTWSGTGITDAGNGTFDPATAGAGTHPISYSVTVDGCTSVDNENITVYSGPTILTSAISPTTYCAGSSISIPYGIVCSFNVGNVFTAQLSDAAGSFAAPVNIGSLTSQNGGSLTAEIPSLTPAGSGYRIRIISSDPSITGTDNGSNLDISVCTRYWVGNAGNWNDPLHWSATSGGTSGASIPHKGVYVYLDGSSFTGPGQIVTLPAGTWYMKSFILSGYGQQTIFVGQGSMGVGQ